MIDNNKEKISKITQEKDNIINTLENEKKRLESKLDYYTQMNRDLESEYSDQTVDNLRLKDLLNKNSIPNTTNRDPTTEEEDIQVYNERRRLICTEILETERYYVNILKNLIIDIKTPIEKSGFIPIPLINKMFCGLPEILQVNDPFLQKLEKSIGNWTNEACIGNLFTELANQLEPYSLYSYSNSVRILEESIKEFPQLIQFFKEKNFNDIHSLFISPIQRITRYILLLENLAKHTDEEHPDYFNLLNGLSRFKATVQNINERIKKNEREEAVSAIKRSLVGVEESILTDEKRIFLYKGPLFEVEKGTLKPRNCFLFNDLFMIAKELLDLSRKKKKSSILSEPQYQVIQMFRITIKMKYQIDPDLSSIEQYVPTFKFPEKSNPNIVYRYLLIRFEGGCKLFATESAYLLNEWAKNLNDITASLKKSK